MKVIQDISLQAIKVSALRYNIFMTKALAYMEQFRLRMREMSKIRKIEVPTKQIQKVYQQYAREREKFLHSSFSFQILIETEKFQQDLSQFLGQTLKTLYSHNGQIYDISNIPLSQIVNVKEGSKGNIIGAYNSSAIQKILNSKNQEMMAPKLEFDKNVTPVYEEVLRRYRSTHNKLVFWKQHNLVQTQSVQSQGSIEEAYVNLAVSQSVQFSGVNWTETDIELFVQEGIRKVDNTSGRLQGDFSIEKIEYAVKSLDASMVGIKQFIQLAQLVLQQNFSIQDLQKVKSRDASKGRAINASATILTDELNQLISQYFASIT